MCCVNALSRFCIAQLWKGRNYWNILTSCGFQGTNFAWQEVHCKGTQQRGQLIDDVFFPWSSKVNPIQVRRVGNLFSMRCCDGYWFLKVSRSNKKKTILWVLHGFTIYHINHIRSAFQNIQFFWCHELNLAKLSKRRSVTWQRSGLMLRKGRGEICREAASSTVCTWIFRKMEMTISLYLLYIYEYMILWLWFQWINKLLDSTWLRILCFIWDRDLRVGNWWRN